nr:reverse transcriptase domain-containing protein [Tanacetum cinerariifolium]
MTTMLKQFQSNPPPAQVKAVEEICVTCGGAYPYYQCLAVDGNTFLEYRDNIQGYVSAATEKIKRMNDVSLKAMQNQIDMVKNKLRNEMKTSIQTSLSNQTNEIKNIMASLLQMNTASTSGSGTLPGNTIANPKGKLKAITTRSGLVTEGPTIPNPPKPVNPKEDECVEETYTDPDHVEEWWRDWGGGAWCLRQWRQVTWLGCCGGEMTTARGGEWGGGSYRSGWEERFGVRRKSFSAAAAAVGGRRWLAGGGEE